MASIASSYFGSPAPTSQLEAPSEIQQLIDFPSDRTTASTDGTENHASFEGIDWQRLRGFEHLPPRGKRARTPKSFVWKHGWRLYRPDTGREYWICKHCHLGPKKPLKPTDFAYVCTKATSSAIDHLRDVHKLGRLGAITEEQPHLVNPLQGQSVLESYCVGAAERNRSAEAFDYDVFKGKLTRFFTVEQIALIKVESEAFRDLLVYCNPRCEAALPTRNTLKRYIASAYDYGLGVVESELQTATTKVNLSFDLWTSPSRRLSLLGVVAHYLDRRFEPRAVLLALPSMHGSHTAVNLSAKLSSILDHFKLRESFGYAITDNASENRACLNLLSKELAFVAGERHVLCMGHIINLVAHRVLFGSDIESFEHELKHDLTAEIVELETWRRKGPIGRLHNIIRYICHSAERRDLFTSLQEAALEEDDGCKHRPLHLVLDNFTRWNSWYDAAERAVHLREYIDEFTEVELGDRYEARRSQGPTTTQKDPPKAPTLFDDKLSPDDWGVIVSYMTILKPFKQATMKLQGNVRAGKAVKGCSWQVLPVFDDLMKGLEDARQRHLPAESQNTEPPSNGSTPPPLSPSLIQPPTRPTNTQRLRRAPVSKASARATAADSDIATPAATQLTDARVDDFVQSQLNASLTTYEHHFSHNINAAWQELDSYYTRTDETSIYRAAVFLHPRLKWRRFEKQWATKPEWIEAARKSVGGLWEQYKHTAANSTDVTVATPLLDEDDEWSHDDYTATGDQLAMYQSEPLPQGLTIKDSPIDYWVSKRSIWPQLSQMALDVYSTPPMSDEPERVFSITGNLMSPRRRHLAGQGIEQMVCLRSWDRSGIITLDQGLFDSAVATAIAIDEGSEHADLSSDNLLYHDNTQID
jgi:hypothetical protein